MGPPTARGRRGCCWPPRNRHRSERQRSERNPSPPGCGASAIIVAVTALLAALALLGPVVVHDADERSPLGSVGMRPGTVAAEPVVYERVSDGWVQYWMLFARNDQDRGVLRTGRHAGDWEMVQFRL